VHEQVLVNGHEPTAVGSLDGGVSIVHCGYDPQLYVARHKDERNMGLLLKQLEDKPDDRFIVYKLALQHEIMGRYEDAKQAASLASCLSGTMQPKAEFELARLAAIPVYA
jgi:hypothetical protein